MIFRPSFKSSNRDKDASTQKKCSELLYCHCAKLKEKPLSPHMMYYIILFSKRHPILCGAAVNHSPPLILLHSGLTGSRTFSFLFSPHTPSE